LSVIEVSRGNELPADAESVGGGDPAGKTKWNFGPLTIQGIPPFDVTTVGAMAGVEIHVYVHVTVPSVSEIRPAQSLVGFQKP
jgi:hypothetical protein